MNKYNIIFMLFGGRSISPSINTRPRQGTQTRQISRSPLRKQANFSRHDSKNATLNNNKNTKQTTQKSKDTMGILYLLEDIHTQLSFNQYDAFPQQKIIEARNNIDRLITFYKDEPICPKHQDLLNLYCENQKQIICVSCMFKGNQNHKNHNVKALESVEKPIQYETIRLEQKSKSLVSQLSQIQQQIIVMEKQICENFMNISNNSVGIINETIRELEALKEEFDKKLSISYRRTTTIIKRYSESLSLMIDMMDSNLQKSSAMQGLGKYLTLKELNKESNLIEELSTKYYQNKVIIDQWRKAVKDTEKLMIKKKTDTTRSEKQDVYVVTKF